ncbi:hypothetical protein FBQ87_11455 [Sphingobacteriales bacterium CHB3]|nr:hypothetical protein [Sphingobacteriales bacterium CHB3]
MSGIVIEDDYIDPDVSYLLGMIVARGTLVERNTLREIVIEFPYQNLNIEVDAPEGQLSFDIPKSIELGLTRIRERLIELLDCDVNIIRSDSNVHMVLRMTRRTMAWRNILLHLDNKTNFRYMEVPRILFHEAVTTDIRLEFIRGFADVAGNVRPANRYADGRNRVRLDVLNDNWILPVQLCALLQSHVGIPVQLITWGHPNMGRNLREHQLNIFVTPFERVGFSFEHKHQVLLQLIAADRGARDDYRPCPGRRNIRNSKPSHRDEKSERLPTPVRSHFDSYWQICKALGCKVEPSSGPMFQEIDEA